MPKEDIRVLHLTEDDLEGVEGWDDLLERMESCDIGILPFEDEAPMPRKVIFNGPATIVLWDSGEKTVVKCSENDEFNYEKGLALAFMKYYCGNTGRFNDILRKHIPGGVNGRQG